MWHGKAKDAKVSIERIRAVMHHSRGEPGGRRSIAPSRKLWTALQVLNGYLVGQSDRLVHCGERHRAGLRVGMALTEGTANFLVNRRMNKSQQMRWSRRGADRLLQVRCAVYNGTLGANFGQRFVAANNALPQVAVAACPPTLWQSLGQDQKILNAVAFLHPTVLGVTEVSSDLPPLIGKRPPRRREPTVPGRTRVPITGLPASDDAVL